MTPTVLQRDPWRRAGEMTLTGIIADLPNTRGNYAYVIDGTELGYVGVAQSLYRRNNGHGRRLPLSEKRLYPEMRQLLEAGHKISVWILIEPMVTYNGRVIDGRHSVEADYITRFEPRWNIIGVRGRRHPGFSAGAHQANAARSSEQRSKIASKAWEKRRAT
jgi:hypothetical protein